MTPASTPAHSPPLLPLTGAPADVARRAQSDRASQEIAQLLLQGWTLLADECPNPTCHGVPLVRRPRPRPAVAETADDDKAEATVAKRGFKGRVAASATSASRSTAAPVTPDLRKLCVICRREYLNESEANALRLSSTSAPVQPLISSSASERRKRAREVDTGEANAKGKARLAGLPTTVRCVSRLQT